MAGTKFGSIKRKLGLKGKTKPGQLISRMNEMKTMAYKDECMKSEGMKYKSSGIKKTGKSFGKSNKLGGGGRFRQVEHAVAGKKGVYNPAGLAAYIGRKSLGKAKFQKLAAKGKKKVESYGTVAKRLIGENIKETAGDFIRPIKNTLSGAGSEIKYLGGKLGQALSAPGRNRFSAAQRGAQRPNFQTISGQSKYMAPPKLKKVKAKK